MFAHVKPLVTATTSILLVLLGSCAMVTVPVKVAGKVATTTVGLAGKAAGVGINAIAGDDDDKPKHNDEAEDE